MGEQTVPDGSFILFLKSRGGKDNLTASSTVVHLEWIPGVVKYPRREGTWALEIWCSQPARTKLNLLVSPAVPSSEGQN